MLKDCPANPTWCSQVDGLSYSSTVASGMATIALCFTGLRPVRGFGATRLKQILQETCKSLTQFGKRLASYGVMGVQYEGPIKTAAW
jgi:hypothetical protein